MKALNSKPGFKNTEKKQEVIEDFGEGEWPSLSPDSEGWRGMEEEMGRAG